MRLYLFRKARQQSSCSAFDTRLAILLEELERWVIIATPVRQLASFYLGLVVIAASNLPASPSTRAWQFFLKNWSAEL